MEIIIIMVKIASQLESSQQFCPRLSAEGFACLQDTLCFPKSMSLFHL